MQAVQYTAFGQRPELVEVEKPTAGPGQVLLRINDADRGLGDNAGTLTVRITVNTP